jgi:hypothetical protein
MTSNFKKIVQDIESHYILFDNVFEVDVVKKLMLSHSKHSAESRQDVNSMHYFFESRLTKELNIDEIKEYKKFDFHNLLEESRRILGVEEEDLCHINFNILMILDSDPMGAKMVENLNRFLYFIERLSDLCRKSEYQHVSKSFEINVEMYVFKISYFSYIFCVDFTNYIYCRYNKQDKEFEEFTKKYKKNKLDVENKNFKINIDLIFDDMYYNPLSFYVQKYRELIFGCPENEIFKRVRDSIPEMTRKHLKTIELFEGLENNKEFIENFSYYLKK